MDRRAFIRSAAGLFVAAAAAPIVEPVRRFWQVGRNAPVGMHTYSFAWDRLRVGLRVSGAGPVWHQKLQEGLADLNAALDEPRPFDEHEQRMREIDRLVREGRMFGVDTDYQQWKAQQRRGVADVYPVEREDGTIEHVWVERSYIFTGRA